MASSAPVGIDNAVFVDDFAWYFRDRHPFWAGCDERPEAFPELKNEYGKEAMKSDRPLSDLSIPLRAVAIIIIAFAWIMTKLAGKAPENDEATDVDDGLTDVYIMDESGKGYSPAQRAAYEHYLKNERVIGQRVLQALFRYYLEWQSLDDWPSDLAPKVSESADMRNLISSPSVYVNPPDERGRCDLEFGFSCWWDPEHGIGARVRDDQVIAVGQPGDLPDDESQLEQSGA